MLSIFCFFDLHVVDLGGLFTKILRGGPLHCVHFFCVDVIQQFEVKKREVPSLESESWGSKAIATITFFPGKTKQVSSM